MTALATGLPKNASASDLSERSTSPESSSGANERPPNETSCSVPMYRLKRPAQRSGWRTCNSFAPAPTSTAPEASTPTMDGVSRPPTALGMISGPSGPRNAAAELVVPRSMPMTGSISILDCGGNCQVGQYGTRSGSVLSLCLMNRSSPRTQTEQPDQGQGRSASIPLEARAVNPGLPEDIRAFGPQTAHGPADARMEELPRSLADFHFIAGLNQDRVRHL